MWSTRRDTRMQRNHLIFFIAFTNRSLFVYFARSHNVTTSVLNRTIATRTASDPMLNWLTTLATNRSTRSKLLRPTEPLASNTNTTSVFASFLQRSSLDFRVSGKHNFCLHAYTFHNAGHFSKYKVMQNRIQFQLLLREGLNSGQVTVVTYYWRLSIFGYFATCGRGLGHYYCF